MGDVKIRTKGKVERRAEDGKYMWWAEIGIEGIPDTIHLQSDRGDKPLLYDTYELAVEGLKKAGRDVKQAVLDIAGEGSLEVKAFVNRGKHAI